jgi:hypothetical protein
MKSSLALILPLLIAGCGSDPTQPPPTPPPAGSCSASAITGIQVADTDFYGGTPYALGYPPYAIDGCRLVYVAPPAMSATSGELRLRDLSTGKETVIAPASESPRRPTIAPGVIAWESSASDGNKRVVRVLGKGDAVTVSGPFDHAGEPRAAEDAIVFTAWNGADDKSDSDIYLYRPAESVLGPLVMAPGQQRFPDISTDNVAWADFSEDPDGTFDANDIDLADVVIYDRFSHTATTRHRDGKQAFPMLGATGKLAYLDWGAVHPEPKFSAYGLLVTSVGAPVTEDAMVQQVFTTLPYVRPVARGAFLEWVNQATLTRQKADLSAPATEVLTESGADLIGPTASDKISLVGARKPGSPVELRAFAR